MAKTVWYLWVSFLVYLVYPAQAMNANTVSMSPNLIDISQQLLYAAKTKAPTDSLSTALNKFTEKDLTLQLTTDDQKKAFWINVYNAYTQIILTKDPDRYKKRGSFFNSKQILVAGRMLSLDDIEHGILRRSRIKWSLGYLGKTFPSAFERTNRVQHIDYRIHFSLNCGAKSCPPIAFYKPEQLDQQLDIATKVYLKGECSFHQDQNKVDVPALMGWFRRDFGGKAGMKSLLKKLSIIPADSDPSIHFKKYNWSLQLANFKNE